MSHFYRAKFETGYVDLHVATEYRAWQLAKEAGRGPTLSVSRKQAFGRNLPKEYYATFLRRVLYHVESGTSLATSFVYVIQAETKNRYKARLQPVADAILRGSRVADALALSGLLDEAGRAMLEAGEHGGHTLAVLETLISRYEAATAVRAIWKGFAVWYLIQYVFAVAGAMWIRDTMIPDMVAGTADKPEQSAALMGVILATNLYIYSIVYGLVAIGLLVLLFTKGQGVMRSWADKVLRQVPGVRSLLHDPAMADTFSTAAWALKAQLRLEQAFALASTAAKLPAVKEVWSGALTKLYLGASVKSCFAGNAMLDYHELQEMENYQNGAQLVRTFQAIADARVTRAKAGARWAFKFYMVLLGAGLFVLLAIAGLLMGVTSDSFNVDFNRVSNIGSSF